LAPEFTLSADEGATSSEGAGEGRPDQRLPFTVHTLGHIDYLEALAFQRELARQRAAGRTGDTLLLAEHPHAFCTGVLGKDEHLLLSEAERQALGVPYHRTDRGGDIMYIGPGQLVEYPIVHLGSLGLDPVSYLRLLEAAVIATLAAFGIQARRIPGLTGVWVDDRKIAGVAAKITRGVATHGLNLNIAPDLRWFDCIVTCGNKGKGVTSMARELGHAPARQDVADILASQFEQAYRQRRELAPFTKA
jgi:lipoyl(octanoyl) transferase